MFGVSDSLQLTVAEDQRTGVFYVSADFGRCISTQSCGCEFSSVEVSRGTF